MLAPVGGNPYNLLNLHIIVSKILGCMVTWQVFYQDVQWAKQIAQEEHIFTRITNNWFWENYLLAGVMLFGFIFLWLGFKERKRLLKENSPEEYGKAISFIAIIVLVCIYYNYPPLNYSKAYLVTLQECQMIDQG